MSPGLDIFPVMVDIEPSPYRRESWAVTMLTIGSLVPLVGWLIGVGLLWTSTLWTRGEKWLGTLVLPGGVGLWLYGLALFPTRDCTSGAIFRSDGSRQVVQTCTGLDIPSRVGVPVGLALLLAPLVVAAVLYARARQRAPRPAGWRRRRRHERRLGRRHGRRQGRRWGRRFG
jgi:hypothetical protein